jgi:aspartyl-tRNA(Asn)/glutamyl-tRNA(Gln) amidotransferase subunit B
MSIPEGWEAVMGLEVHCQLRTESKIFSAAPTAYGAAPNTQVNEVDLGLPGVLPVLNRQAVNLALRAGLALGCQINQQSRFARKNYFYPDLPKGYQITQDEAPICVGGGLEIELEDGTTKWIALTRIHMEEDAGKSSHVGGAPHSLVDLNRAGTPLIEIVSEPELRTPDEVVAYLKELHCLVRAIGVCDGNMEEGSFRCDANVSVRRPGEPLGTRCELKNLNSFKFIKDAVIYEIARQVDLIEDGGAVVQQTRLYNPDRGITYAMRSKEESHDYRYFPDPDLPPLVVSDAWLEQARAELPELPAARRTRYRDQHQLSAYDAAILASEGAIGDYFDQTVAVVNSPKPIANWIINEVLREWSDFDSPFALAPERLASLVKLVDGGVISGKIAKQVFNAAVETGEDPESIVESQGLRQISDSGAIVPIVQRLIDENPDNVAEYRAGKQKVMGWFVGQVMRETRGKANPQLVNQVLRELLSDDQGQ